MPNPFDAYAPTKSNPWTLAKAGHLLRRATFGPTRAELQAALRDGPEVTVLQVKPHDRVMLCSDGLTGVVQDEGMQAFVDGQKDMQACAEGLGQLALDSGSRDNVSCIMIEVIDAA